MSRCINLYIDETGSRRPDRSSNDKPPKFDFFAMGGVLIKEEDEDLSEDLYLEFITRWEIKSPLHSVEIRHSSGNFRWLYNLEYSEKMRFYTELHDLICRLPTTVIGCVIDRTGYNARYQHLHPDRWRMCKTAFSITVERSVRHAASEGRKLRIFQERCGKREDKAILSYYTDLKTNGMPFDQNNSLKYEPINSEIFNSQLYDIKFKSKSSSLMQIADLVLYPIAIGGYDKEYKAYKFLKRDGKLIDCLLNEDQIAFNGIKYSCFDGDLPKPHQKPLQPQRESSSLEIGIAYGVSE